MGAVGAGVGGERGAPVGVEAWARTLTASSDLTCAPDLPLGGASPQSMCVCNYSTLLGTVGPLDAGGTLQCGATLLQREIINKFLASPFK